MKDRPYILFLEDILSSIEKIDNYIYGMSFEDFQADRKTVDAVIRNLEIIGEAAKNIPPEIREGNPNISWRRMIGVNDGVIMYLIRRDKNVVALLE